MRSAADLAAWLLPHAIETDRRAHLAGLVVEECRRRRIVVPSPGALERLCAQSPLSGAWRGPPPADRWALCLAASSAGCADAAADGTQPELARLAAPDTGSGEARRDARRDRATGSCPRRRP